MRLDDTYPEVRSSLDDAAKAFPWEDPHAYANWLAQSYYYVVQSTRLIAFTGGLFSQEKESMHRRFVDHAREERGHEQLLLKDLKALNYKLDDFPELAQTAAFYQSQFYWVHHVNPVALFGYILTLEGLAVSSGQKVYERVVTAHTQKAGNFLRVHVQEDIEHVDQALDQLKTLNHEEQDIVSRNLYHSSRLYKLMLSEMALQAEAMRDYKMAA